MTTPTQVGWIDERGILFPLVAYDPARAGRHDAHKAGWIKVYASTAPVPEQNYAKCYVCDKPMDGKSEDDCHCFHRRELASETVSVLAKVSDSLVSELTGYRPEQLLTEREATSIRERGQSRWNQLIAIANNATLVAPEIPRKDWQKRALELGFVYWRASDAHGVSGTPEKAVRLLEEVLGVEVEVEPPKCSTCDDRGIIGGPSYYSPDEGGEPCPDCAPIGPLPPAALADARAFGAGLDAASLEQPSEVSL